MNVIKESFKFCKKYSHAWITIILIGFLTVIVSLLLPQLAELIIDRIINPAFGQEVKINDKNIFNWILSPYASSDYSGMFAAILLAFVVLLLIRYGGHYIRWNIAHYYGCKAEKDFRMAVFKKMLNQNTVVLNRYTSGDLMSIANSDPVAVKDMYGFNFSVLMDQFVAIFLAALFLSKINWILMIIPMAVGVFTALLMVVYIRALRIRYNEIRTCSVALNSCVQENINGVRIIRSFGTETGEVKKFAGLSSNYMNSFLKQSKVVALYNVWFSGLGHAVNLSSMILGVVLAAKGQMTTGQFTSFLAYIGMINGPLIAIANVMGNIQNGMICGNRMFTFLNTSNIICDPVKPEIIDCAPNISLKDVCVQLDDCEVLKNINLDLPYGKKLGIMGKTGSGKSVLIKTFARFFETTRGETCINGINVKNIKVDDVRHQFSYVMQDVFLFSNTVDSNIAFYNMDAPHEDVVKAAKIAAADSFINKLSEGYNTIVGERGLGLSGGQKQRVSIARALLKDAPVLLFDDCTSALDMETERSILNAIEENYKQKTLVISSHRATSVEKCDEIIFMQDGEIAERGTHSQLMAAKGLYYEVYTHQAAANAEAVA